MHFWSFWAKHWHILPILPHARPKTNANKVPRWAFRHVRGTKRLIFKVKKGFFAQKWPNLAFLFIAGSLGALLVVVARGLYLARHLFTLSRNYHQHHRHYYHEINIFTCMCSFSSFLVSFASSVKSAQLLLDLCKKEWLLRNTFQMTSFF